MENEFVFCHDVSGLVNALGSPYVRNDWRLFIDSSKQNLKCVTSQWQQIMFHPNWTSSGSP